MPDATAESNRDPTGPSTPTVPPPPPPATSLGTPPVALAAPPPPGNDSPHAEISGAPLRPGQFSVGWQIMLAASWTAAFFAYAAVWKTSEEIGIGTWWLGARAQPQPLFIRIAPLAITLALGMLAVYNVRRSGWISAAGAVVLGIGAAFDVTRSGGLAAIEFAIAASMLLISVGAVFGALRAPSTD